MSSRACTWSSSSCSSGSWRRAEGLHRVRRARHRRQGRDDQGDHRAREPARVPRRGVARADGARAEPDVHAALHAAPARGRGGRDLRPQLVQPRRRRAGDGIHARSEGAPLSAHRAAGREGDRRVRHHPAQVLAGSQRGGTDAPAEGAGRRRTQALEALADGPEVLQPVVRLLAGPRRHVRRDRYRARAMVRGAHRRQAPRATQHHPPPARPRALRGTAAREVKFPKRQKRGDYVEPDHPYRTIPARY